MIPGELFLKDEDIELNKGRKSVTLSVANTGDRPIQVGSHYHSIARRRAACGSIFRPERRYGLSQVKREKSR